MDEIFLLSYLRGECNDEEAGRVEAWCKEAPENRKVLEQLYYTLFVGDRVAMMNAVDTEASLDKFKSAVREKEKKAKRKNMSIRWGRYSTVAAAFLARLTGTTTSLRFASISACVKGFPYRKRKVKTCQNPASA